jgi:hypothetical protein
VADLNVEGRAFSLRDFQDDILLSVWVVHSTTTEQNVYRMIMPMMEIGAKPLKRA